jgi:hypothetical protein
VVHADHRRHHRQVLADARGTHSPHWCHRVHRQPPASRARGRRPHSAVPRARALAGHGATGEHRSDRRGLPRRSVASCANGGNRSGVLPGAFDGKRPGLRGARSACRNELRPRGRARRSTPHHLPRRTRCRPRFSLDPPEEPHRNGRRASRGWCARRRVPRLDRGRSGKLVVRDDSRAGRASTDHDLPEMGRHAYATNRHR